MNKEKQIEDMCAIMSECYYHGCEDAPMMPESDVFCDSASCNDCKKARLLLNAGYRKQSDGELTKAHIQAHYEAIYALADMVCQFGYPTTFRKQKAVCDGGLSALEYAFGALLDCGCKMNSNGTITLKNLFAFREEIQAKMKAVNDMVKHYCDWCGAECKESELTGINVPTKNLGNGSYLTKKIEVCPACNKEHDKILDMLIEFRIAAYNNLFIQKGARE